MKLFLALRAPHKIVCRPDPTRQLQERMVQVVETYLRYVPELTGTGWPLEVSVHRGSLVARLTRGELQLKAETAQLQWWKPQSGRIAAMWGRELVGYHKVFADADLNGPSAGPRLEGG